MIDTIFTFTNVGKEPLIISNAKAGCGCTVPQWPKEPIAPAVKQERLQSNLIVKANLARKINQLLLQ